MAGRHVFLGVGVGLGILAVAGYVWGRSDKLLRAVPTDKRASVLIQMARMRPVSVQMAVPGLIPGRSQTAEARPTTPGSWSESVLSWIEAASQAGFYVAYWEQEDPNHTVFVAFTPEEEASLAAHRYKGPGQPGWLLLLEPKEFWTILAGENREDLLKGKVSPIRTLAEAGTHATYAVEAVDPTGVFVPLSGLKQASLSSPAIKGRRYQGVLRRGDAEAVVEGVYQGIGPNGKGQLLVERIVRAITETPPPKGLYQLEVTEKDMSNPYLQTPVWGVLHPTSVSLSAFDPSPSAKPVGKRVILAVRETNGLGQAVLVIDGTALPAEPGDGDDVRISTGDFIKKVRSADDVALPPLLLAPLDMLVDPASLGA